MIRDITADVQIIASNSNDYMNVMFDIIIAKISEIIEAVNNLEKKISRLERKVDKLNLEHTVS